MVTDELKIILSVTGQSAAVNHLDRVHKSVIKLDSGVGKLASSLAKLVSVGAILKFSKQCVQAAADLQRVSNVMNITFGSTAEKLNTWVKEQAAAFGLTETAAKKYLGVFGNLANQFGYTAEQAATMGVELTKISSDVAAFYGITTDQAFTKLQGIFTGRATGMKELGIVLNDAQLNAFLLQKGINKTVKELSAQDKVTLRYMYTMEKLNHTQGFFQKSTGGWAHSLRDLKINIENLKVSVGKELLPVAVYTVSAIAKGVQAVAPAVVKVAQTVRLYTEAWKNASTVAKGYVKIALGAVGVMLIAPKIISVISTAIELLTAKTLTLGTAIKGIAGLVGIIFTILAFKELNKEVQKLKEQDTNKKMEDLTGGMLDASEAVEDLSDSVSDLGDSTKGMDLFLASFDEVNKVGGSSSLMSGLVTDDDIANILGAAAGLDDLQSSIDGMNMEVEVPETPIFSLEWWQEKKQAVIDFFKALWEKIQNTSLFKFFERCGAAIADFVEKHLKPLISKIGDFFRTIASKVSQAIADIKLFAEAWVHAWEQVGAAIADVVDKLKEFIQKREEAGASYWDRSHDDKGNATTTGAKILDKIIGADKYAGGGIPDKGSLFIAGEQGPELIGNFGGGQTRVINQQQLMSESTSSPAPILFQPVIQIDGRKISAVVVDNINNMTRSSGNSPLIELG